MIKVCDLMQYMKFLSSRKMKLEILMLWNWQGYREEWLK